MFTWLHITPVAMAREMMSLWLRTQAAATAGAWDQGTVATHAHIHTLTHMRSTISIHKKPDLVSINHTPSLLLWTCTRTSKSRFFPIIMCTQQMWSVEQKGTEIHLVLKDVSRSLKFCFIFTQISGCLTLWDEGSALEEDFHCSAYIPLTWSSFTVILIWPQFSLK